MKLGESLGVAGRAGWRKGKRFSVEEKIQMLREVEVDPLPPPKIVDMAQALT